MPYAETMGAFKELYDAGLVRRVGLSNADAAQIPEAHDVLGDGAGERAEPVLPGVPQQRAASSSCAAASAWRSCRGARSAG